MCMCNRGCKKEVQEVCGMVNREECRIGDLYRKSVESVEVWYRKSVVSVSRKKIFCDVIQMAEEEMHTYKIILQYKMENGI